MSLTVLGLKPAMPLSITGGILFISWSVNNFCLVSGVIYLYANTYLLYRNLIVDVLPVCGILPSKTTTLPALGCIALLLSRSSSKNIVSPPHCGFHTGLRYTNIVLFSSTK